MQDIHHLIYGFKQSTYDQGVKLSLDFPTIAADNYFSAKGHFGGVRCEFYGHLSMENNCATILINGLTKDKTIISWLQGTDEDIHTLYQLKGTSVVIQQRLKTDLETLASQYLPLRASNSIGVFYRKDEYLF